VGRTRGGPGRQLPAGGGLTGTADVAYTTDAPDRVISRVARSTTTYTYRGTGEEAAKA